MAKVRGTTFISASFLFFIAIFMYSCHQSDLDHPVFKIISVEPDSGYIRDVVTIKGQGFSPQKSGNIVLFNKTKATVDILRDGVIVTKVPDGATTGPIKIRVLNKSVLGPNFKILIAKEPLSITTIHPSKGPAGTKVTFIGSGFSSVKSQNIVRFNGEPAKVISAPSRKTLSNKIKNNVTTKTAADSTGAQLSGGKTDSNIVKKRPSAAITSEISSSLVSTGNVSDTLIAIVPETATTGPVQITVNEKTVTGPRFTITKKGDDESKKPHITGIKPASGKTCSKVTITGKNFSNKAAGNTVKFGGNKAAITSASTTKLSASVPHGLKVGSSYSVVVHANGHIVIGPKFKVTGDGCKAKNAPVITSMKPGKGPIGTPVTLKGSHLDGGNVHIGKTKAAVTSSVKNKITFKIPKDLKPGKSYTVTVTNNKITVKAPQKFTVTKLTKTHQGGGGTGGPVITDIKPASGKTCTQVTIGGKGFSKKVSEDVVKFGGKQAVVKKAAKTQLTVTVPKGLKKGTVKVTVTVNGKIAKSVDFKVTDDGCKAKNAPVITSMKPGKGPIGTPVTLKGSHLDGGSVHIGKAKAKITSSDKDKIVFKAPESLKPGQSYTVTVTNHGHTVKAPKKFSVISASPTNQGEDDLNPPVITNIKSGSGKTCMQVTIGGKGFSKKKSEDVVKFGGKQAVVKKAAKTQLTVTVPKGLKKGTVKVTVTVNGKIAKSVDFKVTGDGCKPRNPIITSIVPAAGPVGTKVTIKGSNLDKMTSRDALKFNGAAVTNVQSSAPGKLVVIVPKGATTGKVTVTISGKTATGPVFTVLTTMTPKYPIKGSDTSIQTGTKGICAGCGITNKNNIIDGSESNYGIVTIGAGAAGGYYIHVNSASVIPSGGNAGFIVVREGQLIDAGLLGAITITTYLNGTKQEQKSGSGVLFLHLLSKNSKKLFVSFKTSKKFDAVKITFSGIAQAALRYDVYGAYGGKPGIPAREPDPPTQTGPTACRDIYGQQVF
jgi:hypothetical protein